MRHGHASVHSRTTCPPPPSGARQRSRPCPGGILRRIPSPPRSEKPASGGETHRFSPSDRQTSAEARALRRSKRPPRERETSDASITDCRDPHAGSGTQTAETPSSRGGISGMPPPERENSAEEPRTHLPGPPVPPSRSVTPCAENSTPTERFRESSRQSSRTPSEKQKSARAGEVRQSNRSPHKNHRSSSPTPLPVPTDDPTSRGRIPRIPPSERAKSAGRKGRRGKERTPRDGQNTEGRRERRGAGIRGGTPAPAHAAGRAPGVSPRRGGR